MPSYPSKFQPGDTVTIRTWDHMLSQYGGRDDVGIRTPYAAFSYDMKQCCGRSFKIKSVRPSINDKHWIYVLDCCYFPFTEDMFVFAPPVPASTISFDDLMKGVAQ
jgi:hypothetical protein